MAERVVTTTTASASLGGANYTGQVSTLNNKFIRNTIIRAEHFSDMASLFITATGHTHDWVDRYGQKTFGNTNPNGYSNRGSQETNSVAAIDTNFGFLDGVAQEQIVDRNHYNYFISIYNVLRNHKHSTEDSTS